MIECTERDAKEALKVQESQFLQTHIHEQRTLVPEDAVSILATKLGLILDTTLSIDLADALENITLKYPPAAIEGAADAVTCAASQVPVGVISDTGVATGRTMKKLLDNAGFENKFTSYTFSDETGVSKPQAAMYNDAAAKLEVPVESLLHIGDLEPTDIAGALGVGAQAALFTGDNDRFLNNTKVHHTFTRWADFVDALPKIAGIPSKISVVTIGQ